MVCHVRPRGTPDPHRATARCRESVGSSPTSGSHPSPSPTPSTPVASTVSASGCSALRGSAPTARTNGRWPPRSTSRRSAIALRSAAALWRVPGFAHRAGARARPIAGPHRGGGHLGIVHSTVRWAPEDVTDLARHPGHDPATDARRPRRDGSTRNASRQTCDRMLDDRVCSDSNSSTRSARRCPTGSRRPGVAALRRLIERATARLSTGESNLERRFETILAEAPARHPSSDRSTSATTTAGSVGSTSSTATNQDRGRDPERPVPLRPRRPCAGPGRGSPDSDGPAGSSSRSASTRSGTARTSSLAKVRARRARSATRGSPRQA